MLHDPSGKYRAFPPIDLSDRQWPSRQIIESPRWCSVDLRDGNQALIEPMSIARKWRLFRCLVAAGFKEIEVGFPAASQTDFDFVRELVTSGEIPSDVSIQVLTQARDDLIERTFDAVTGAHKVIVHVYNATSPVFRRVVFAQDRTGIKQIAVTAAQLMRSLADARPETQWQFEYSPETFTATELDFARDICAAVIDIWQPSPGAKAILNLPATVEVAAPNYYADQIEWMDRHLPQRDAVTLSLHPHNDRGTGVAAAELGLLAGADRVEGCLFGNGERTGNVDIVTLALNMYTQGIHPGLDFSNIDLVAHTVEACTQLPIHPRHPYVGDLVFTAFSGSHQDAIKKGFAAQEPDQFWEIPYIPLDPADVGRTYASVVRVNSQSGKGGIAYLLERDVGYQLPRRLQIEFSTVVQPIADAHGRELDSEKLHDVFVAEYLRQNGPCRYLSHQVSRLHNGAIELRLAVLIGAEEKQIIGRGQEQVEACVSALGFDCRIQSKLAQLIDNRDRTVVYLEITHPELAGSLFGVGVDRDIVGAEVRAVLSAYNRLAARVNKIGDEWPTATKRAGMSYRRAG